jgi:hypothetical protein
MPYLLYDTRSVNLVLLLELIINSSLFQSIITTNIILYFSSFT